MLTVSENEDNLAGECPDQCLLPGQLLPFSVDALREGPDGATAAGPDLPVVNLLWLLRRRATEHGRDLRFIPGLLE